MYCIVQIKHAITKTDYELKWHDSKWAVDYTDLNKTYKYLIRKFL